MKVVEANLNRIDMRHARFLHVQQSPFAKASVNVRLSSK